MRVETDRVLKLQDVEIRGKQEIDRALAELRGKKREEVEVIREMGETEAADLEHVSSFVGLVISYYDDGSHSAEDIWRPVDLILDCSLPFKKEGWSMYPWLDPGYKDPGICKLTDFYDTRTGNYIRVVTPQWVWDGVGSTTDELTRSVLEKEALENTKLLAIERIHEMLNNS